MEVTVKLNLYHCYLKAVSQLSTGVGVGGGGGVREVVGIGVGIGCFLSSGCTENVPFFFEHFGDVAYSFVQYIGHTGMDSSHLLVNIVVFFHVFIRSLNGIVHILECHVKEEWLLWVMGLNYLFYSLISQTGKMYYNSERFEPGSHFISW